MSNIYIYIFLFFLMIIIWLLWEIHRKLHKMLEIQWQSFLVFEKRLDEIIKKMKNSSLN